MQSVFLKGTRLFDVVAKCGGVPNGNKKGVEDPFDKGFLRMKVGNQ